MTGKSRIPQLIENGRDRAEYGCTVTFENSDGKRLVIHRQGPPRQGLRDACEEALALDPTFLVVAYSTPQTIYVDLQGTRHINEGGASDQVVRGGRQPNPEYVMLGQVGLKHLCHPRLISR